MRKILSLILALCLGCVIVNAASYQAKASKATLNDAGDYAKGCELSENPNLVSVTLDKDAKKRKDRQTYTSLPLYDGENREKITDYGEASIQMRHDTDKEKSSTASIIVIKVSSKIQNVRIYYTGDGGDPLSITLVDAKTNAPVSTEYTGEAGKFNDSKEYVHLETVSKLSPGTYHLYSVGFSGGFLGLYCEDVATETQPDSRTKTAPDPVSTNMSWDFSDVTGHAVDEYNRPCFPYGKDEYASYAYFYSQYVAPPDYWWETRKENPTLYYNKDFKGEQIAFAGQYPIRGNYAQDGTLMFNPTVDGYVRVSFTDTGDKATTDAIRRYLAINGEKTEYWTCRGKDPTDENPEVIPATLNVTSGFIPVSGGKPVYISGIEENGTKSTPICVSKVEFIIKTNPDNPDRNSSLVGITNDTFTQRTYYYENGKSVCTWRYGGYKHSTHGLQGGVDDNGILYVSSDYYDKRENPDSNDDNTNGNITFMIPSGNATAHWLSCCYGSAVYLPVNAGSSGTITITCTQDDYSGDSKFDRYFELHKELNGNDETLTKILPLQRTSSMNYSASDISTVNGSSYIKLVNHYTNVGYDSNGYLYKGEMKVYSFTVAMNTGNDYTIDPPETDYDHEILGEHSHAVFNWTQGDVYTEGFHYGTLKLANGAVLTGVNPDAKGDTSGTETIHSYRNGDIVKYKTNYYGGLQLLSGENTVYTITPPPGYYITTSVRIHGHNNQNYSKTDEDKNLFHDTYISNFYMSDFKDGGVYNVDENKLGLGNDDTYMKFPRDDKNARTTTLDFTTTATESVEFKIGGYQIFGVIDAVIVPKEAVPALGGKLFYKYTQNKSNINVDITNYNSLRFEGTINYTPDGDEELWWYFVPDSPAEDENYGSRGCFNYTSNEDINKYPADDPEYGVKDQYFTKTFSVLNYKFVNATGSYDSRNNLSSDVYDIEGNYKSTEPSEVRTMADGTSADGKVSLAVNRMGTYYFYIRDKATNFNSPLGVVTFNNTTGVEDITIEDNYETDELDAPVYNIYGQRVDSSYRGIVIRNGRKYVQK